MITRPLRLLALFALILTSGILALKLAVPPRLRQPDLAAQQFADEL